MHLNNSTQSAMCCSLRGYICVDNVCVRMSASANQGIFVSICAKTYLHRRVCVHMCVPT